MTDKSQRGPSIFSGPILWQFFWTALLWLVPAVLLLPIYVIVLAISMLVWEGAAIELLTKFKGGINSALGLLLVLLGVAALVFLFTAKLDAEGYVYVGVFSLICGGLGGYLARRELRRMASAS